MMMSMRPAAGAMLACALLLVGCGGTPDAGPARPPVTSDTAGLPLPGFVENEDGSVEVTGRLIYVPDGDHFALVDGHPTGALLGNERVVGVIVLEEGDRHGGDLRPLVGSYVQFDGMPVQTSSEQTDAPAFVPQTMRILADATDTPN